MIPLTHEPGYWPIPNDDLLGVALVTYAVSRATWYDWLGLLGLLAFTTRCAFHPDGLASDVLDWSALCGVMLIVFVIGQWAA